MNWKNLKGNPDLWEVLRRREKVVDAVRAFFKKQRFLEVFTPSMVSSLIPESYLEVFETELKDKEGNSKKMFLTPSPEIWHKKLITAGSGNIFEITKSFRNTDCGGRFHHPEFTILEWYRTNCDYRQVMEDCENLIRYLLTALQRIVHINKYSKKLILKCQGKSIDISRPFARMTVAEAFEKYTGVKKDELFDLEKIRKKIRDKGYEISDKDDWETIFTLLYVGEIEPNLGWERPTIIYDYPSQFSPLSKTSEKDERIKERFELYIGGVEIADGCTELTDAAEQKKEFSKEIKKRKILGKSKFPVDWDFVSALKSGLPPCAGVALGIDRLLMVLLGKEDIREVIMES